MELEVINPEHEVQKNATQRKSQTRKYLYSVTVQDNKSVMLSWQEALWEFGFHTEKENSTYPWVKTNTIS
jgi:DNA/RNA-binding domain of Phe-tRNA-synthetase-like protein